LDIAVVDRLLENATLAEIWDHFLQGQARLLFNNHDQDWLADQTWWHSAKNVLEIGCGNGCYLSLLSEAFPEKTLEGVDYNTTYIEKARDRHSEKGISFRPGNAEEELPECRGKFDVVFFRFTLQWLKNPRLALEIAHSYLKPGGKLLVIDSYDPAAASAEVIPSLQYSIDELHEKTKAKAKGNRLISMELLNDLEGNEEVPLKRLYGVERTTLDKSGNRTERGPRFESKEHLSRYLNQNLLWFGIMRKQFEISVDLPQARKELQIYLDRNDHWVQIGMHYLLLDRIEAK
jgi:ubiquinone/menaquinone biosynthesis C-methylase UbiE